MGLKVGLSEAKVSGVDEPSDTIDPGRQPLAEPLGADDLEWETFKDQTRDDDDGLLDLIKQNNPSATPQPANTKPSKDPGTARGTRATKFPKPPPKPKSLVDQWIEIRTPAPIFREGASPDVYEKAGASVSGVSRRGRVTAETTKYLQITPANPANGAPFWIERSRAKPFTPVESIVGKTVELVAPTEVPTTPNKRVDVKSEDFDRGIQVQIEIDGKLEWIRRSHVVVYDKSKDLSGTSDPASLEKFAMLFNAEFKSVIGQVGVLTADTVEQAFKPAQRAKLVRYFATHLIPDRLFTDDEGAGGLAPSARILIAAHMFTVGKYQRREKVGNVEIPEDPEKLRGRNCGHWVTIVNHYAGVTPGGGHPGRGVFGSFDQAGNLIFGKGALDSKKGKYRTAETLPGQEDGVTGPIQDDTDHGKAKQKEQDEIDKAEDSPSLTCGIDSANKRQSPSTPSCGTQTGHQHAPPQRRVGRFDHIPLGDYSKFQPGDWLWFYNANSSNSGSHSVIFVEWIGGSPTMKGTGDRRYAEAMCFGQGTPQAGGSLHKYKLGVKFHPGASYQDSIFPVNAWHHTTDDAGPAETEDEILQLDAKKRATAAAANATFMAKQRNQPALDPGLLAAELRTSNTWFIEQLATRITPQQKNTLLAINRSDRLESLVALWERMRGFHKNAAILDRSNAQNAKAIKTGSKISRMVHGSGSVSGEDMRSTTARLANVPHIVGKRGTFAKPSTANPPATPSPTSPASVDDDSSHRPP